MLYYGRCKIFSVNNLTSAVQRAIAGNYPVNDPRLLQLVTGCCKPAMTCAACRPTLRLRSQGKPEQLPYLSVCHCYPG